MEKRALIALGLSFLVFIVFMYIGEKTRAPQLPPAQQAEQAKPAQPVPAPAQAPPKPAVSVPAAKPAAPPKRPAKDVVVETPLFRAVFTDAGGRLKSFQLKKYKESLPFTTISDVKLGPVGFELERYHDPENSRSKPKELVRPGPAQEYPLSLNWQGPGLNIAGGSLICEASQPGLSLKDGDQGILKFTCASPEGLTFVKTYTFKADSYGFDLTVQVINHTGKPLEGQVSLDLSEDFSGEEASRFHFLGFNGSVNNKWEEIKSGGLKQPQTFTGKIDWAGLDEGYFLTAMVPNAASKSILNLNEPLEPQTKKLAGPMVASLQTPVEGLAPGQDLRLSYGLFFGPKDLYDLRTMGLEGAINFGWFDFLGKPLLRVLKFFKNYSLNYGWAIIILTFLIRIVFFYPNHKSYKSMKDMQKLQPKVAKLREKYKDDKETMNRELMALYKTFKVNPLAGCLPMVIQLPVFIALYNVLGYAIELRHASFIPTLPFTNIVWLADLSTKDPLLITPIVMGATMFIQQKMTPSAGDPTQAKMMMFLPLIFTFMFLNFASGLVIYWLVNNVLSIIQQHYTNKYLT
ncbi:MAG: membrane protein insertase YidC [Deltaproteobacteria bacterium]|nr:membrane protein insertase YidC [Deltaproteobacteria bacterium]